jgi:putative transposon-encoded protein
MSFNIIKKNTGSPFYLQRSIVDQGGEGGAYESGGYTGGSSYNNDAANAAIESIGTTVGAALSSRTAGDKNKSNIKAKERLQKKSERLTKEGKTDRATKVTARAKKKEDLITEYEKSTKVKIPKATIGSKASVETEEVEE